MRQDRWKKQRREDSRSRSSRSRSAHRDSRQNQSRKHDRNDRHRNKHHSQHRKNQPKFRPQPPKSFLLSAPTECHGPLKLNLLKSGTHPQRSQASILADLKNQITPIQKLWGSHIKQYLNISEFVQIHRHHKSLAQFPIEYGKSVINYSEDFNSIQYSNLTEQSQIFSRAYFKLWEILETGVMEEYRDKQMSIGCVAEGPGGFIHALVDYRIKQQRGKLSLQRDTYNAITLKIDGSTRNAKDWQDSRGKHLFSQLRRMGQSIHLSYGKTGTGDLLDRVNIEYFSQEVKRKCQLVTGDGGIECIGDKEFEYQEIFNCKLFFGEIITAVHIQQIGGKFILKIYDCGFELTRQLIILLALYYDSVQIIKPITSRPGNSEKYLLCQGFRGITPQELSLLKEALAQWTSIEPKLSYFENKQFVVSLFDFSKVSNHEVVYSRIKEANEWFVQEQIQKIEEGLALAEKHQNQSSSIQKELQASRFGEQVSFAYSWCTRYGLPTIDVLLQDKQHQGDKQHQDEKQHQEEKQQKGEKQHQGDKQRQDKQIAKQPKK